MATSLAAGTPVSPSADTVAATPVGTGTSPELGELGEGSRVGRYRILRRLGEGGMGVVYAAHDAELARDVALKVLRADRGGNVALETRLQREAQAMARLAHGNVVRVFDVGSHEGHVFLAMELIDGVTVADWLTVGRRSWREIVDVYRAAGRGLAEAHAAGIVHRDFKPGNVMIDRRGRVVVTDFGLARTAGTPSSDGTSDGTTDREPVPAGSAQERLTRDGALVGTPRYMSPEQLERQDATTLSDQFSFAVALFEGVARVPPFRGGTTGAVLEEIRAGHVAAGRMPGWLRRVLVRALASAPERRFSSMDGLLAALDGGRKRGARIAIAASVLAVGAAGATVAVMLGGAASAAPACARAADRVEAAWTPAQRARVLDQLPKLRPAFGAQTAQRVISRLDAYASQVAEQRVAACRATVDDAPTSASYDAQCLDAQLRSLATVARALSTATTGDVVDRADAILGQLTDCERGVMSSVKPPVEAMRIPVDHVRDLLASAVVLIARGDYAAARDALRPVVASARALGYPPLLGEAVGRLGFVELQLQDPHADADLTEAAEIAAAARDDHTAVRAWTNLLSSAANEPDHPDRFTTTLAAARTEAARTGDPADRAEVDLVEGNSLTQTGKLAEGEVACKRALDALVKLHGNDALEVRPGLHCVGTSLEEKGDYPNARLAIEHALAIDHKILGDEHPDTADDDEALGQIELRTGRFKEGLVLADKALQIRERVFGPGSDLVAKAHQTLANLLVDSGHDTEALPHAQIAIRIATANHGAESTHVAAAYGTLGTAYHDLHRRDEARQMFEHAIAIYERAGDQTGLAITLLNLADLLISEKKWDIALPVSRRALASFEAAMGKSSPIVGFGLYDTARCLNATGHADEALPLLERALALNDPATTDPNTIAIFKIDLAKALWETNKDRARAIKVAHEADQILISIGDSSGAPQERANIEAFLRAHPTP